MKIVFFFSFSISLKTNAKIVAELTYITKGGCLKNSNNPLIKAMNHCKVKTFTLKIHFVFFLLSRCFEPSGIPRKKKLPVKNFSSKCHGFSFWT